MKKIFLLLSLLIFTGTSSTSTASDAHPKKLILWGIKGVLFYPDMSKVKGGGFGALLGYTPDYVEKELFGVLQSLYVPAVRSYTRTYPMLIEGWLTGALNNWQAKQEALKHIKNRCGLFQRMRLKAAAEIAFTPYESAKVLSANPTVISLAQSCKAKGHTIAICSSWNTEAFNAVKNYYRSVFDQFDTYYISGNCNILACEERFYEKIVEKYGAQNVYLIDCLQENLQTAHKKGITTIYCANLDALQYELKKHELL